MSGRAFDSDGACCSRDVALSCGDLKRLGRKQSPESSHSLPCDSSLFQLLRPNGLRRPTNDPARNLFLVSWLFSPLVRVFPLVAPAPGMWPRGSRHEATCGPPAAAGAPRELWIGPEKEIEPVASADDSSRSLFGEKGVPDSSKNEVRGAAVLN